MPLPSRWLTYCYVQGCPPTVPAMARDLARPTDDLATQAACVLIASKFEEVEALTQQMLRTEAGLCLDVKEAAVLARTNWRLPIHTAARTILHLLADRDAFYDDAVYALLDAGVDRALPPAVGRPAPRAHRAPRCPSRAMVTGFRRVRRKALRPRLYGR